MVRSYVSLAVCLPRKTLIIVYQVIAVVCKGKTFSSFSRGFLCNTAKQMDLFSEHEYHWPLSEVYPVGAHKGYPCGV